MLCKRCEKEIKKKKQNHKEFDNWEEFMNSTLKRIIGKEKTYADWEKERDQSYKNKESERDFTSSSIE